MYVIRVNVFHSNGQCASREHESEHTIFKEALREVMGKVLAGMSFVPERIEFVPQREEMSEKYHEFRSCKSKKAYVILAQAQADAAAMNRKFTNKVEAVYSCKYCPCWHVGRLIGRLNGNGLTKP